MAEGNQSTRITKFGPAVDLQYVLDKKLHSSPQLHKIGEALLDPTYVAPLGSNSPTGAAPVGTVGQSDEVARADHVHAVTFGVDAFTATQTAEPATITITNQVLCTSPSYTMNKDSFFLLWTSVDWDGTVGGYGGGVCSLEINFAGAGFGAFGPQHLWALNAGQRSDTSMQYGGFVTAGTIQFRMVALKIVNAGTLLTHATHTGMLGLFLGG